MEEERAMEESGDILLDSLAKLGVPISPNVSSVRELSPATLYTLSSQSIRLIDRNTSSFCQSLPEDSDSMAERVNASTELASAFRKLGFVGDLSFHQFLYPTEEDLYKLVGFLVNKLSESSSPGDEKVLTGLGDLGLGASAPESSTVESDDHVSPTSSELNSTLVKPLHSSTTRQNLCESQNERDCCESKSQSQGAESLGNDASWDQDVPQEGSKKQMVGESAKLHELEEELQLLKEAEKIILDGEQPVQSHIEKLGNQVEEKRHKLKELEAEWDATEKTLLERKGNLKQSLLELHPEAYAKLTRSEVVEVEIASVLAHVKRREEEISKLSSELEKQPKLAPRRSYIERINEITKNSRKQDADIQRILKDTREVQLECNTIQERLSRTYAVVDETIFREAKKDPVARQAYRLLANIHESFEKIAEKILATDRRRRDAADYEAKLAAISGRSLNLGELEADLDAIRKENELLEQRLSGN